jgi:hypothetical protein
MEEGNTQPVKEVDAVLTLTHELFGESPVFLERLPYGNINRVYEVRTKKEGNLIIQLHPEKNRVQLFFRGNDAMGLARKNGVPAPVIIATGNTLVPYAYMIYRKIEGITAVEFAGDKAPIWQELGVYAKRINLIDVPGYGRVGYWKNSYQAYYDTWDEYVIQEIEQYSDSEWLEKSGFFTDELRNKFLKHTIVDEAGKIVGIIDWDETTYGKAPEQELATIFPWITEEEKQHFLAGYGMSPEEWGRIERGLETMEMIKYIEFYTWFAFSKDEAAARDMAGKFLPILEK